MNARRVRDTVPGIGWLSRTALAQQGIRGLRRGRVLRGPIAFVAHELLGTKGRIAAHDLVDGGTAVLRHRTRDVDIFDETLVEPRAYKQPTEVHVRLSQVPSPRVLDLGGNIGLFALDCLRGYPLARVTCVEADPENISILRACAHLNPQARWTIIAAAASIQNGTVMFAAGNFADSAVSAYGTVSVPSIDVFPLLTDVDFVKMDIEGSEWPIVMDQRFESITAPVIVIEWHVRQAPAVRDPHALMLSRLNAAGYETAGSGTADHGTIWGWK